ncbi:MAG: type 1 glutamine amidotransferase [Dehalococcoidia bacterium]|nr:type 1 glutamine amidotransferase [Dehalococcoidia bacterium]
MKLLIFQQVQVEGPGLLGEFLKRWGIPYDTVAFYKGDSIPPLSLYEALIVLGGPMNVYEEDKYLYLSGQDRAIKQAISQSMPFLGICLGAQLLAKASGAKVVANPVKEIGFSRVQLTAQASDDRLFHGLPPELPVFQWHGDTFHIPDGAIKLASSSGCDNQAFCYGKNTYALQFHLEVTPAMVTNWISINREELREPGRPVVGELTPPDLPQRCEELRRLAEIMFSNFIMEVVR